jgi:hypothetical protein
VLSKSVSNAENNELLKDSEHLETRRIRREAPGRGGKREKNIMPGGGGGGRGGRKIMLLKK